MNIKNTTGGTLTCSATNLPWGKWNGSPPTQITNGQTVSFGAQGAKGSATGTSGSVTYMFADNQTSFTINWDIPYSGSNSGTMTVNGPGSSNYTAQEMDSTYQNVVSFPTSGSAVTVYYGIGAAVQSQNSKKSSITESVAAKIKALTKNIPVPAMDIASVARAADCGEVSGPELVVMFKGKTTATCKDILNVSSLSAGDRVRFVSNRGLISPLNEFTEAVEFAAYVIAVLKPEKLVYELAEATIQALRDMIKGAPPPDLEKMANAIEDAKALMLAQRDHKTLLPQVAALDGILACIYMSSGAALAQAGSCARDTAADVGAGEKIEKWQLARLLELSA
ncbi:aegerolysin family protein [Polaromonas sp.]|uniref:aegerolysin family protein n=1 Tax=Polaromonas sp. TaxID=1869339 RepID=UPI00326615FA